MRNKEISRYLLLGALFVCSCSTAKIAGDNGSAILQAEDFKHYVDYFNKMEDENIAQAIPNAASWNWMKENIPLFTCPQQNFEEIFYYRWWTLRKHIKQTPAGYVFTEFLVERSYADQYNLIACAIGHHVYEGRWLHNPLYLNDYLKVWYRGNEGKPMKKLHGFSSWTPDAVYNRFLVSGDTAFTNEFLPDLQADFVRWESENKLPSGLFWQSDVKDGMEETISGGRRERNARPTINSYMYGNAKALAAMADLNNQRDWKDLYLKKADTLKQLIQQNLWNKEHGFFEVLKKDGSADVKEAIGFIPWYFNLPDAKFDNAWKYLMDTSCFHAPFGLTTADRRHPEFRTHGCCKCEWDGAVWPFATSQTLTAMANLLNTESQQVVNNQDYFELLNTYVESQYYRGRPYIGEYLDESTGYWLKGDQERSRYYNHSTFNDLLITGLVGLRPQPGNQLEINPLILQEKWDWFCLDNILYRGNVIAVVWDKDGTKFNKGQGLSLFINGKKQASRSDIGKLNAPF